jgi:hypothetical protein
MPAEQMSELKHGELVIGPPKTDAGVRTVAIPSVLISLLFGSFTPVYLPWLIVVCVPILFTTFRQGTHDLAANVVVIDERVVSAYEQIAEMASGRPDHNDVAR